MLRDHYRAAQAERGRDAVYPLVIPGQADFRKTFGLVGREVMTQADAWRERLDAVGLIGNPYGPGGRQADVWELPYGALLPKEVDGLLVAGRALAARDGFWEILRLIPACAATGQAAGVAAALAVEAGRPPATLDPAGLRQALEAEGVKCRFADLYGRDGPARAPATSA